MMFSVADFPLGAATSSYQIDAGRGVHIEEFRGRVGICDLRYLRSLLVADPVWSPVQHALIDLADADLDLSANDVLRLALLFRREEFRSSGWQIFVVPPGAYGTVRMLAYWMRASERTRIFNRRAEAEEWLERNAGSLPPGSVVRPPGFGHGTMTLRNAG